MNEISEQVKELQQPEPIEKIKVSRAEIVVHGSKEKPYYEIKYHDLSDGNCHIGYSSYELDYVFRWLEECFELVEENRVSISEQLNYGGGWIVASERMPEEERCIDPETGYYGRSDYVLCSAHNDYEMKDEIWIDYTIDGEWQTHEWYEGEKLAWQPLPEPYRP